MKRRFPFDEALSEEPGNWLILGDGNLSYSLGLAERLPNAKVWCTTYDAACELQSKYRDSASNIRRLQALGARIKVLHGIDAMSIAADLQKDGGEEHRFDHIVFNHPHTGWEDINRHRALLAHFLDSCKPVLEAGGMVHVTLAGDQSERWQLLGTASRLGYTLRGSCDFYRQFGREMTPTEVKRHQSGRSFRLRGLPSTTYSFSLSLEQEKEGARVVAVPWKHSYVEGAEDKGHTGEEGKMFICGQCDKRFRGPRHLRQHEKSHEAELEQEEDGQTCEECKRTFKDSEALEQHKRAVHSGKFRALKPDWSKAALGAEEDDSKKLNFKGIERSSLTDAEAKEQDLVLCLICDFYSPSDVKHFEDLHPPPRPTLTCPGCSREFHEDRALKQHANSCEAFLALPEPGQGEQGDAETKAPTEEGVA